MRFLLYTILCIFLPCLGAYATTEHIDLTFRKNIFFDSVQYQAVAALPLPNGGNMAVVSIPNGNSGCVNTACVGLFLYGANGQLLPGMPIVKNGGLTTVTAAAIDHLGRIVVIGTTVSATNQGVGFGILRFYSIGTADGSFNGTGGTRIDFDQGGNNNDIPTALAIDSDNSIVIVGWVVIDSNNHTEFGVVRLNANGSLDSNFGSGGKERIGFNLNGAGGDQATAVAIGSNHKIIVAGNAYDGTVYHPVLAQLFAAGATDPTFCPTACFTTTNLGFNNIYAGRLVYYFGSFPPTLHDDHLNSVDVNSNGDIVIAGNTRTPGNSVAAAVALLSASGNSTHEKIEAGREGNSSFTGVRFTNVPGRDVIAAGETGTLSRSFIVQAFDSALFVSANYGNCLVNSSALCFVGNNENLIAHPANQAAASLSLDSSGRPLFAGTYVGQSSNGGTVQQSVLVQRISNDSDSIFHSGFEIVFE